jgi:hypothetical protein
VCERVLCVGANSIKIVKALASVCASVCVVCGDTLNENSKGLSKADQLRDASYPYESKRRSPFFFILCFA